jgi:hypothetical protein
MEYGLARRVLGSPAFVPIAEDEYDAIRRAREGTLECMFLEEKFDLVVENHLEFETTLLEIVARDMIRQDQNYHSFQLERGLVDRRIANLLSAAKVYVDHAKQHVHRILELDGAATFDVDATLSTQYDTRFGYRCMEALRNHVQHHGFPVHTIRFNREWIDRQGERLRLNAVSPYVEPARLREDGEFKKSVLVEMEARGEKIDLKELIRDYVEGLSIAHFEIRGSVGQCAQTWDTIIKDAIQGYATENPDEGTLGLCVVKRSEDQRYSDWVPVLTDPLDQRGYFESKNGVLTNLTKRFITSEVIRNKST